MTDLFKIGTTDLTPWEDTEQHSVNREDVYEEWTDGDWLLHRVIAKTRISGSVVLRFTRESDYTAFVSLMASQRTADGYYNIVVWCSNTNTSESLMAFLDIVAETVFDVTAPIKGHIVTVAITGR